MTRSELIGQLRQFIMLESDPSQLDWWAIELSDLAKLAQQRAADSHSDDPSDPSEAVPPPFVGTG